jgi:sulfhydrogenase subunit gamma (sulfur reductase)
MERTVLLKSPYLTYEGRIIESRYLTKEEKYFKVTLKGGRLLDYEPGQFVMVAIPGVGEAPLSISSSPSQVGYFELVVRKVGTFTSAMHMMEEGDLIGIRGPLGTGFPIRLLEGNDLLFIAGGLGIIPLRSLINYVIDNRRDFGKVSILIGCKAPENLLFNNELEDWQKRLDVNLSCTVDKAAPDWHGNVGLITSLIPGVNLDSDMTYAITVGPPIMYRFVIAELLKKSIPESQIYLSFERHMKCGVGHCGHCQLGSLYCCKNGPVFNYGRIKNNIEAFG